MHHPIVPAFAQRSRIALTEPELIAWGERFGRAASAPLLVALSGDLGAGKTTLTKAICHGYGVTESVTSPTFALVHRYASPRGPVYHLDLYRLRSPDELTNIGWDDIVAEHALLIVEWPGNAGGRLPPAHVSLDLEHVPDDVSRRILLAG